MGYIPVNLDRIATPRLDKEAQIRPHFFGPVIRCPCQRRWEQTKSESDSQKGYVLRAANEHAEQNKFNLLYRPFVGVIFLAMRPVRPAS